MQRLSKSSAQTWLCSLCLLVFFSCKKTIDYREMGSDGKEHGHLQQTKTFSSEVVIKWLNMQLDMLRVPLPPGTAAQSADRTLAYNGIALYEAVVQGMPSHRSLAGQLTDFPAMPDAESGKAYHWAAAANAALAYTNRKLFANTAAANKTAMDALENSLQTQYATEVDANTLQRSIDFGREVAKRVYDWAATDGSANVNPPYVPPVGAAFWVPTTPTPPVNPYAAQRRLLVPGVAEGASIAPPPAYSADPASPFFAMVKDVYDKSVALTDAQKAQAIYHRDAPGYPGGGHFVSILAQVFSKAAPMLDDAALAYVKTGISFHDAGLLLFIKKYSLLQVRPITYIRNVMGITAWNPLIPTPNHPEFPSAHATLASAVAVALTNVFGNDFSLTDHTYDYLNFASRNYASFFAMAKDMSDSRVFGGIHYQATCDNSLTYGAALGANVLKLVRF